jgi:hypothetical protein
MSLSVIVIPAFPWSNNYRSLYVQLQEDSSESRASINLPTSSKGGFTLESSPRNLDFKTPFYGSYFWVSQDWAQAWNPLLNLGGIFPRVGSWDQIMFDKEVMSHYCQFTFIPYFRHELWCELIKPKLSLSTNKVVWVLSFPSSPGNLTLRSGTNKTP